MKKIKVLLLLFVLQSCQYFDKQIPSEKELLKQQLKEINWDEVDEYPSVLECEKLSDEKQRKQCFFEFLTSTIQQKLNTDTLSILYPELDTIEVKITVNSDATMLFEPLFPKDSVTYDKIKIDSIIRARLIDLPKINPALKRGIPVKTQFILPVILKVE